MKIHRVALVATVIGTQLCAAHAPAVEVPEEKLDALVKRIDELEQKLKVLERKDEIDKEAKEAADAKEKPTPTVSLGANGFVIRSGDSNFVMNIHGYAQTDGRFYLGNKTVNDTLLLRRVRPIIEGTVYDRFDYRIMLDFASNITSPGMNNNSFVDDAYVNGRILPDLQVQVGKFKAPVGLERLQSTANLPFVETGLPTQFTPNYDVGAIVHNGNFGKMVNYEFGVFNGVADGGSDDIESTDEGKEMVARVFASPFVETDIAPLRGLGLGVGGSYGYRSGATRNFTTQGQQTFFGYGNATTTVTASGNQYRLDPQAYYYWGPFGIQGEYVIDSQSLRSTVAATTTTARYKNSAWQIIGSYFLTGEDNSFKPVTPSHPLGISGGGWGAWEVVGRIGQMHMDSRLLPLASTTSAQQQTSWGAGVNWHLNRNVKLQLDYESTTFHNGSSAAGSATGKPEHVILSRAQFSF